MKACVISSYPPPPTGIATYTSRLCHALVALGIDVTVLSNTCSDTEDPAIVTKAWNENTWTYPLSIFGRVNSDTFDIIHVQHEYWLYGRGFRSLTFLILLALLRLTGKPIVVTVHEIVPFGELTKEFFRKHGLGERGTGLKRLYFTMYNKIVDLLTSKTLVHSRIAGSVLINDYFFRPERVSVVPHGVNPVNLELDREDERGRLGLEGKRALLVFGGIRRGKGIEYAIAAMTRVMEKHPSSTLIVAGMHDAKVSPESVGYLDELKALVERLGMGEHVKFTINLPENNVGYYFRNATMAILPYDEDEIIAASGPGSLALGFGLPIIATSLRRFSGYLIPGRTALIVPPSDSDALAEAIIRLLQDDKLRKRLSMASKRLAEELSWGKVAQKTRAVYDELVAR